MDSIFYLLMQCDECDHSFRSENDHAKCPMCGENARAPSLSEFESDKLLEVIEGMSDLNDTDLDMAISRLWWFDGSKENYQACFRVLRRLVDVHQSTPKIDFALSSFVRDFSTSYTKDEMEMEEDIEADRIANP